MSVDIIIEDSRWEAVALAALSERAVAAALRYLSLDPDMEVVVMGCDDARIAALNADFRGKPVPTNVLSWPSAVRGREPAGGAPVLPQTPEELGDIAIAFETTKEEAEKGGISLQDHATHLIVHGTLHLLGYDHEEDTDGDLMESVETAILASLGIADPYSSGATVPDIDGKD